MLCFLPRAQEHLVTVLIMSRCVAGARARALACSLATMISLRKFLRLKINDWIASNKYHVPPYYSFNM